MSRHEQLCRGPSRTGCRWPCGLERRPGAPFDTNKPLVVACLSPGKDHQLIGLWSMCTWSNKYQRHPGMLSELEEHNSQELLMFHSQFRAQSSFQNLNSRFAVGPHLKMRRKLLCWHLHGVLSADAQACPSSLSISIGLYLPLHRLWVLLIGI
jgi:hypothetical protein